MFRALPSPVKRSMEIGSDHRLSEFEVAAADGIISKCIRLRRAPDICIFFLRRGFGLLLSDQLAEAA